MLRSHLGFKFATIGSVDTLIDLFDKKGYIDDAGVANSLHAKLKEGNVNSFINQVKAQSGNHINNETAVTLLRDAQQLN